MGQFLATVRNAAEAEIPWTCTPVRIQTTSSPNSHVSYIHLQELPAASASPNLVWYTPNCQATLWEVNPLLYQTLTTARAEG